MSRTTSLSSALSSVSEKGAIGEEGGSEDSESRLATGGRPRGGGLDSSPGGERARFGRRGVPLVD